MFLGKFSIEEIKLVKLDLTLSSPKIPLGLAWWTHITSTRRGGLQLEFQAGGNTLLPAGTGQHSWDKGAGMKSPMAQLAAQHLHSREAVNVYLLWHLPSE